MHGAEWNRASSNRVSCRRAPLFSNSFFERNRGSRRSQSRRKPETATKSCNVYRLRTRYVACVCCGLKAADVILARSPLLEHRRTTALEHLARVIQWARVVEQRKTLGRFDESSIGVVQLGLMPAKIIRRVGGCVVIADWPWLRRVADGRLKGVWCARWQGRHGFGAAVSWHHAVGIMQWGIVAVMISSCSSSGSLTGHG